jgi:hypothetical protein
MEYKYLYKTETDVNNTAQESATSKFLVSHLKRLQFVAESFLLVPASAVLNSNLYA